MDTYRLVMSPRAFSDLEGIHKYISEDSAENAAKTIERILDALDALILSPHHNLAEGIAGPRATRTLPVPPFVIYFEVLEADRVVRVIHIRHGARRRPTRLG